MKRVTIKDIAERCGVSKSAVAYIVGNAPGYNAPESTRKLVLSAARELGYKPNYAAKSLSSKRSYSIGILMPAISTFYGEMALQLQESLWEAGYCGLFSFWSDDEASQKRAVEPLVSRGVDGVVCWPGGDRHLPPELAKVLFSYRCVDADSVSHDFQKAMEQALVHLKGLGHRKIGYIGRELDIRHSLFRTLGAGLGLEIKDEWVQFGDSVEEAGAGLRKMKGAGPGEGPTAIVAYNDAMAIAAIGAAWELGLSLPRDLSFIGFDNLESSRCCHPQLSSFDWNMGLLAERLVALLIERIKNPELPLRHEVVEARLALRASTANPPSWKGRPC